MLLFYIVLTLGFGGFAITIPWLIYDEWVQARQQKMDQRHWSSESEGEGRRGALMRPSSRQPISFNTQDPQSCMWNFRYPHEVICDPTLSEEEKRSVLSSWASDMHAVESFPALRHLPGTPIPVTYSSIMDARLQLDRLTAFGNDNDPTPPFCPAASQRMDGRMVA